MPESTVLFPPEPFTSFFIRHHKFNPKNVKFKNQDTLIITEKCMLKFVASNYPFLNVKTLHFMKKINFEKLSSQDV